MYEADLGGGLFKKRVARAGGGKSGGYRTLIATNQGDR
ncbi:type II toxin-antitoxin system RelE/ParE family toxin [Synechococcus elongatus]